MGPGTGVESPRKSPIPTPSPPSGYRDLPEICPLGCPGKYFTGSVLLEARCYKIVPGDLEVAAGHSLVQGKSWAWGSHRHHRHLVLEKLQELARQNQLRPPALSLQRPLLTELVIAPAGKVKKKCEGLSLFPEQAMKGEFGAEKQ